MSRTYITDHIDRILTNKNLSLEQFQAELKRAGIEPDLYQPKGKWSGISYTYDSIKWSGSKLGSDYTPSGLLQRGVKNETLTDQAKPVHADQAKLAEKVRNSQTIFGSFARQNQKNRDQKDDNRQAVQTRPAAPVPAPAEAQNPLRKFKFSPDESSSDFTKVCCQLANLALELGAVVFEAVRNFFRWLMKKLGFGDAASDLKTHATTPEAPARLVYEPEPDYSAATTAIEQLTAAVQQKDPALLPAESKDTVEYDDLVEQLAIKNEATGSEYVDAALKFQRDREKDAENLLLQIRLAEARGHQNGNEIFSSLKAKIGGVIEGQNFVLAKAGPGSKETLRLQIEARQALAELERANDIRAGFNQVGASFLVEKALAASSKLDEYVKQAAAQAARNLAAEAAENNERQVEMTRPDPDQPKG